MPHSRFVFFILPQNSQLLSLLIEKLMNRYRLITDLLSTILLLFFSIIIAQRMLYHERSRRSLRRRCNSNRRQFKSSLRGKEVRWKIKTVIVTPLVFLRWFHIFVRKNRLRRFIQSNFLVMRPRCKRIFWM